MKRFIAAAVTFMVAVSVGSALNMESVPGKYLLTNDQGCIICLPEQTICYTRHCENAVPGHLGARSMWVPDANSGKVAIQGIQIVSDPHGTWTSHDPIETQYTCVVSSFQDYMNWVTSQP